MSSSDRKSKKKPLSPSIKNSSSPSSPRTPERKKPTPKKSLLKKLFPHGDEIATTLSSTKTKDTPKPTARTIFPYLEDKEKGVKPTVEFDEEATFSSGQEIITPTNPDKTEDNQDITIFSLTDPELLKKVISFTKQKFCLNDNKIAHIKDGTEILAEIKIRPGQNEYTQSHPYIFLHEIEADLRYEDLGRVLRCYKPDVIKKMASLALKIFRQNPINTFLEEFDQIIAKNDFLLTQTIDFKEIEKELEDNYLSPYKKKARNLRQTAKKNSKLSKKNL